jgi:hypothetical protein
MKFTHYNFPGPVADIEWGPEFKWIDRCKLELTYKDYQNELVKIVFIDVLGVKYQCFEIGCPPDAEDSVIEFINSEWLLKLCSADNSDPQLYHRILIGFNERGMMLEIAYKDLVRC